MYKDIHKNNSNKSSLLHSGTSKFQATPPSEIIQLRIWFWPSDASIVKPSKKILALGDKQAIKIINDKQQYPKKSKIAMLQKKRLCLNQSLEQLHDTIKTKFTSTSNCSRLCCVRVFSVTHRII